MVTLSQAKRLVVKIGSALLVDRDSGALRSDWLDALVADVAAFKQRDQQVVLVSSGSIALGRGVLGLGGGQLTLEQSQAAAAAGQIQLARAYDQRLAAHGLTAAQVLLTLDDSEDRRRYLNARATLSTLLSLGSVPIVNENDTVATDEIRYGDNDRLAAQIAVTVGADILVLLSDVDGLYTANPHVDLSAKHIPDIVNITPELEAMAGDAGSGLSKGGMRTKLMAARIAMAGGTSMAITQGEPLHALSKLDQGATASWFHAQLDPAQARKRWIAAMKPKGEIAIDAGAVKALAQGKSLLPAGVTSAKGEFGRGEPVVVLDEHGRHLGQGLCRYTAEEARAILGLRSNQIEDALGYSGRAALIHRDDLALEARRGQDA